MRGSCLIILATVSLVFPPPVHSGDWYAACLGGSASTSPTAGVKRQAMTEQAAHDWLGCYKTAWDRRDVEALTALGVIRAEQQPALRKALAAYKRLDVSVSNESISLEGGQALLAFDRVDRDETGKELRHPRQTVVLDRRPAGIVSTWRGTR